MSLNQNKFRFNRKIKKFFLSQQKNLQFLQNLPVTTFVRTYALYEFGGL